jgi:hypothetical protein
MSNVNKKNVEQSEDEEIASTFMDSFFRKKDTDDFQNQLGKF